jgi:hypothetical protein
VHAGLETALAFFVRDGLQRRVADAFQVAAAAILAAQLLRVRRMRMT